MITGLIPLVSKVVIFGINLFIRNRVKREAMKANFDAFVKKFDGDSKESGKLHRDYEELRRDSVEGIPKDKSEGRKLDG
jgi:hypothetical protein